MKEKQMINLICRLIPDRHVQFKIECAKEGKSMNQVVNKLIQDFLDKKKAAA